MVFNASIVSIIFIVLAVWLAFLTVLVLGIKRHYDSLLAKTHKDTLSDMLHSLLESQKETVRLEEEIKKKIGQIEKLQEYDLQKIGILRFNPFSDTGGSQSFSLAILDNKDNGIVMTSLYARTGNRWYIKQAAGGKGVGIDLSQEEKTAIKNAKRLNVSG